MAERTATVDPIKLCCHRRASEHQGSQCPDGKVMCCLCFKRFEVADLFTHPGDDKPSDVCAPCGLAERSLLNSRSQDVRSSSQDVRPSS